MAIKRKVEKISSDEIFDSSENLLNVIEDSDAEADGLNEAPSVQNPLVAEEDADYDDPYYFSQDISLRKKSAFYKPVSDSPAAVDKDELKSVEDAESQSAQDEDESQWEDLESEDEIFRPKKAQKHTVTKPFRRKTIQRSSVAEYDEYADGDSSDEEEIRNTIGNVPVEWYDEYDHIGYDHSGQKILKPDRGDSLDAFLKRVEDPNYLRTVEDRLTGQDVELCDGDLELLHRVIKAQVPSAQYDMYEPFLDLYSHEVMETPLSGRPEHKRSFLPSRSDRKKVSKMVHAIKQGLVHRNRRQKRYHIYDLWKSDTTPVPMRRRIHKKYRAPPATLPTNMESYNPPPEYLPTKSQYDWINNHIRSEKKQMMLKLKLARKFNSVRQIPAFKTYVMDNFSRLLDLYMCSRFAYKKVMGRAKDLLPNLPRPRDLRPYPTREAKLFAGHKGAVRCIAVHPLGFAIATGSDDYTVKIWEISTGRCLRTLLMEDAIQSLSWCPNTNVFVLAVSVGTYLYICNPESYIVDAATVARTNAIFERPPNAGDFVAHERVRKAVQWLTPQSDQKEMSVRIVLQHTHKVQQIVWHPKGDYFATLQRGAASNSVLLHQLSRWRSQIPFSKKAVTATAISFHPKQPYFYLCCQSRIYVYSLTKASQIRNIKTEHTSQIMSCLAVHPTGEHFITGSFGKRIVWYEMECTNRPHTLSFHHGAIRSVAFHNKYPLFASSADDNRVIVTHAMVYKDWVKDPLLVPVKELFNHKKVDGYCVLQVAWHPHLPLLFTAGADGTIRMWQ